MRTRRLQTRALSSGTTSRWPSCHRWAMGVWRPPAVRGWDAVPGPERPAEYAIGFRGSEAAQGVSGIGKTGLEEVSVQGEAAEEGAVQEGLTSSDAVGCPWANGGGERDCPMRPQPGEVGAEVVSKKERMESHVPLGRHPSLPTLRQEPAGELQGVTSAHMEALSAARAS